MRLVYYLLLFTLSIISFDGKTQGVSVKVVYNNTSDMKNAEGNIDNIIKVVNKQRLVDALNSNGHISDKNLKITVAFFDRGAIGQLHLKAFHELTPEAYIEKWKSNKAQTSSILFLFCKNAETMKYEFKKMVVSTQLEEEHLFPLVSQFINEHLSGDETNIVSDGTRFLAKAITPVWNEEKKREAEDTVKEDKYQKWRFNFLHQYWQGDKLLDLTDYSKIPATYDHSKIAKVWFKRKDSKDTLKPKVPIYISTDEFNTSEIEFADMTGDTYLTMLLVNLGLIDSEKTVLLELSDTNNFNFVKYVSDNLIFSNAVSFSKLDWDVNCQQSFKLRSNIYLTNYVKGDKLWLHKVDSKNLFKDGDIKPPWVPGYERTYCNVYASDLSRHVLFPNLFNKKDNAAGSNDYAPWGKHACANDIHEAISEDTINFKEINNGSKFDEWKYTEAGYVVYYTKSNSDSKCSPSGHIAICFDPKAKYVINAGGSYITINKKYKNAWNEAGIKKHVYLGYILIIN